jgi:hypothetical protein
MTKLIGIDFVAGTHGHFLETTLNKFFGIIPNMPEAFTHLGTSHNKFVVFQKNKLFHADHWSELYPEQIENFDRLISIRFDQKDLLLVSSVSLLRTDNRNIDNDDLHNDTVAKLKNRLYESVLEEIYLAYPFLDRSQQSIPRYVLREYFKFGFKNPSINGYWKKQQLMTYSTDINVLSFDFASFYNVDQFVNNLRQVEEFVGKKLNFSSEFYEHHSRFLKFIPYQSHKSQCDHIIECVLNNIVTQIPDLTLFQESYINGQLENIFHKEMPFHQDRYFTSTVDMLYYITNLAPNL